MIDMLEIARVFMAGVVTGAVFMVVVILAAFAFAYRDRG